MNFNEIKECPKCGTLRSRNHKEPKRDWNSWGHRFPMICHFQWEEGRGEFTIICGNCDLKLTQLGLGYNSAEEAIEAWNNLKR